MTNGIFVDFHQSALAGIVRGCLFGAMPDNFAGVLVDKAGKFVGIDIAGQHHGTIAEAQTGTGADPIEPVGVTVGLRPNLRIQDGGIRPSLTAVLGGHQPQIGGIADMEPCIEEEHILLHKLVAIDLLAVHGLLVCGVEVLIYFLFCKKLIGSTRKERTISGISNT